MRAPPVSNRKDVRVSVPWTGGGKRPDDEAAFSNSPYLNFNDDKLKFDMNDADNPNENYGAVSFSVPKSLLAVRRGILADAPSSSASLRADPPAEHSADLVDMRLERSIFLRIDRARFFH